MLCYFISFLLCTFALRKALIFMNFPRFYLLGCFFTSKPPSLLINLAQLYRKRFIAFLFSCIPRDLILLLLYLPIVIILSFSVAAVHCAELLPAEGLTISDGSTKMNTRVMFTCREGMRLNGSSEAVCLPSGNWSYSRPSCYSKKREKLSSNKAKGKEATKKKRRGIT